MSGEKTEPEKEWITPRAALAMVDKYLQSQTTSMAAITGRLKGGEVRSKAQSSSFQEAKEAPIRKPEGPIPQEHWEALEDNKPGDLWGVGDVCISYISQTHLSVIVRYYGISFNAADIRQMLVNLVDFIPISEAPAAAVPPAPILPHPGGRPRKEFWDDLMITMFKKIWDGDLQPKAAADIERSMLEWAEMRRFKLSESSVKEPAKKLFKAYKSGVKN